MLLALGWWRIALAATEVVALIGNFQYILGFSSFGVGNFFGYFTIQSNIIAAVAFLASAYFIFRGTVQPSWVVYLRALATVLMAIVGIVYNTLLSNLDLAGSFNLQWSNDILHIVIPIYAVLDWVLFGDRDKLPFANLWYMLIYPAIWLVVVLIRGAADGWVPYPFLDPAQPGGYLAVLVYALAIAAFTILFAYGAYALTRVKVLKP